MEAKQATTAVMKFSQAVDTLNEFGQEFFKLSDACRDLQELKKEIGKMQLEVEKKKLELKNVESQISNNREIIKNQRQLIGSQQSFINHSLYGTTPKQPAKQPAPEQPVPEQPAPTQNEFTPSPPSVEHKEQSPNKKRRLDDGVRWSSRPRSTSSPRFDPSASNKKTYADELFGCPKPEEYTRDKKRRIRKEQKLLKIKCQPMEENKMDEQAQ